MTRYLSVIYIILIILSGIFTCGCDRQPHSDVEAVVDRWIGKTIKFPGDSIGAFIVGYDTVASPFLMLVLQLSDMWIPLVAHLVNCGFLHIVHL